MQWVWSGAHDFALLIRSQALLTLQVYGPRFEDHCSRLPLSSCISLLWPLSGHMAFFFRVSLPLPLSYKDTCDYI